MIKKKKDKQKQLLTKKDEVSPNDNDTSNVEWERTSIILRKGIMKQLKAISHWERKQMRETVSDALETFLYLYNEHNRPIPEEPVSLLDKLKNRLKQNIDTGSK